MASETEPQLEPTAQELSSLSISSRQDDGCIIFICSGPSDCRNCIDTLYRPIMNQMEDSECTGLVIDKRRVFCSPGGKNINLVAETILRHNLRSVLRKLAIVTTIEYKKDEQLLLEILYKKGVNIRLFTELDPAIHWAKSYP